MRVLVLGAGVVGITTAYALHKRGHTVEVVDRNHAAALECSFANGGQLSYNHTEPWSNPTALKQGITWLGKKDAPLLFRLQSDPYMWLWTLRFLLNCTNKRALWNNETILRLALYSREMMHRLTAEVPLEFDYLKTGRLFIFSNEDALKRQWQLTQHQMRVNPRATGQLFNREQCIACEPALADHAEHMVGGVFNPDDESGDIAKFTQGLAHYLKQQGVVFRYNTTVQEIIAEKKKVKCIRTDSSSLTADAYVMSLGSYGASLLRKVDIHAPIYPLKGYSISVDVSKADPASVPKISMTHSARKLAYSTLGNVLRIAGTAEFAGYNDKVVKHRIDIIKKDTSEIYPRLAPFVENATEWACLRPMTPDGPPIIGGTRLDNLFMNTGQGFLGWTEAAGSAEIVADVMEGKQPAISLKGMEPSRYLW